MALIPDDIISQIIERCDLAETIGSYLPLKKAGRNFKANCPFHNEKTPSFVVNPEKQIFHCFGCGVGGNVITFLMKHDRLEFPEAVKILAQKVNIVLPEDQDHSPANSNRDLRNAVLRMNELAAQYFHNILLSEKTKSAQQARDYLKSRKVSLQTVKDFQLGYALDEWEGLFSYLRKKEIPVHLIEKSGLVIAREKNQGYYDRFRHRVMFPILDQRGQCRAFGGRILETSDTVQDKSAKYINSPETDVYTKGHYLYGLSLSKNAIVQNDCAVIVEGYMDCLMPYQHGVTNIVASLGTALTVDQIRLLRRYTHNVIFLFDMDPAGQNAMMRSFDTLVEEGLTVKVATLKEGADPDSFIKENGVELFKERLQNAQDLFDYKLDSLRRQWNGNTIEDKAKISKDMLTTIQKYDNAVIRSEYLRKLAKILQVDPEALTTEVKKMTQKKNEGSQTRRWLQQDEPAVVKSKDEPVPTFKMEYSILKIILEQTYLILSTQREIGPENFQDVKTRQVISKVYELFSQGRIVSVSSLMNHFDDPQIHDMLSRLSNEELEYKGDREKIHRDLIVRIKGQQLKVTRKKLLEEIRKAEESGDHSRLDQLKNEFNALVTEAR